MTDRKRAWARITTASSAALLLMAVISLWQVFDDYNELYNPESNSLVKLEPGDSVTLEIENSGLVSALRVSDGGSPDADLKLTDSQGDEVLGRGARALEFDRYDEQNRTSFSVVRVFENIGGEYTLENLGTTTLWLVDDEDSANKLSGIVWTYLFYIGCCLGSPIGLIGFVLAIMVWTGKRKMPDQVVIIEDGRVIIGNAQSDMEGDQKPSEPPNPFSDTNRQPPSTAVTESSKEKDGDSWKSWDEG